MIGRRIGDTLIAGLALVLALPPVPARSSDSIAVLTEIRAARGQVHVKLTEGGDWAPPKLLQSLRAGDQVRVVGDARAVIVIIGGRSETIAQDNSPFTIVARAGASLPDRARSVIDGVTSFLIGQQHERTFKALVVRSVPFQPPTILGPRDTRVLPGTVVFEWRGPERLRYGVRLLGSQGRVLWERQDLEKRPLNYPGDAPGLTPGTSYVWELETKEYGVRTARFETASTDDAASVRDALSVLTPATATGYSAATLTLMRAGLLFERQFYADARRELETGIAAFPDEPTLHLLLAHVYDRIGLKQLAAQSFDAAESLNGH
jgi:hypothetical protein